MTYQSWDWSNDGGSFTRGERNEETSPRGYGMRAIKRELNYLGFSEPSMIDNGNFGASMEANVKAFQKKAALPEDGKVGPVTMKRLCRRRVLAFEAGPGVPIPEHLLCRTIDLESAWYPSCRNTTEDYGIAQIHEPLDAVYANGKPICPNDDMQYAYRIGANVRYLAEHMRRNFTWLKSQAPSGTTTDQIWRAAVFAHNAPAWAIEWMAAGFPDDGGGERTVGDWVGQKFAWATLYTNAVYGRSC